MKIKFKYLDQPGVERKEVQRKAVPYTVLDIGGLPELKAWKAHQAYLEQKFQEKQAIKREQAVDRFMAAPGSVFEDDEIVTLQKVEQKKWEEMCATPAPEIPKVSIFQQVKQACVKWMLDTINNAFGS